MQRTDRTHSTTPNTGEADAGPGEAKPVYGDPARIERRLVRYTVKPDCAQENDVLVRAVYAELAQVRPAGLRYQTFRLDDGLTFFHLAAVDTEAGPNPLRELPAFKEFQADIGRRCDQAPVLTRVEELGSFQSFGD